MTQRLIELKDALLNIRTNGPSSSTDGLCFQPGCGGPNMERLMAKWPRNSKRPSFPVPAPDGFVCIVKNGMVDPHGDAYFKLTHVMWDKDHEYGRNRWELVDFLIMEIEKELQA